LGKVTWWTELAELKKGEERPVKKPSAGVLPLLAGSAFILWWLSKKEVLPTDEASVFARMRIYDSLIEQFSNYNGIQNSDLVRAIIVQESKAIPSLLGTAGEVGLMQIRSIAARDVGYFQPIETLFDPAVNIQIGTLYLRRQYDRVIKGAFPSTPYREAEGLPAAWWNAISAYNAGSPTPANSGYVGGVRAWYKKFVERR